MIARFQEKASTLADPKKARGYATYLEGPQSFSKEELSSGKFTLVTIVLVAHHRRHPEGTLAIARRLMTQGATFY